MSHSLLLGVCRGQKSDAKYTKIQKNYEFTCKVTTIVYYFTHGTERVYYFYIILQFTNYSCLIVFDMQGSKSYWILVRQDQDTSVGAARRKPTTTLVCGGIYSSAENMTPALEHSEGKKTFVGFIEPIKWRIKYT